MNRAMRRKLENKGYSIGGIAKIANDEGYNQGYEKGKREATEIMLYMTMYTAEYKLDLTHEELLLFMDSIINNISCFATGHLEKEDYDTIKKEMNEIGFHF